jgi:hypothetical protein
MDESQVASKVGRLLAIGGAKFGSSKSGRPENNILIFFFRSQQGALILVSL